MDNLPHACRSPVAHDGDETPPISIADCDAGKKSGGNNAWELLGTHAPVSSSGNAGQASGCVRDADIVLIETFLLPLCPGKLVESIRMTDVIIDTLTNGVLWALFALSKRENNNTAVSQASQILRLFGNVPQLALFTSNNAPTELLHRSSPSQIISFKIISFAFLHTNHNSHSFAQINIISLAFLRRNNFFLSSPSNSFAGIIPSDNFLRIPL